MSEDVSAYARLSVTVVLLAALTAVVLNMAIVGNGVLSTFTYNYTVKVGGIAQSSLHALPGMGRINAVTVYKVLETNAGAGHNISITIGGSTYNDTEVLRRNASKEVEVTLTPNGNVYDIDVVEVN